MDIQSLPKFPLRPQSASYSVASADTVIGSQLNGGASRTRIDVIGGTQLVNVTFKCTPIKHKVLEAFYNTVANNGSLYFAIDLVLDSPDCKTYKAKFVPNSKNLDNRQHTISFYSAQLEVYPLKPDADFDNSIVTLYNENDGSERDMLLTVDYLEQLVNIEWSEDAPWL